MQDRGNFSEYDRTARLDRIEEKIDKLSEAMIVIARTEEKMLAMEQRFLGQFDAITLLREEVGQLKTETADNSRTVAVITKVFWIIVVSAVGVLVTNWFAGQ